MLNSSNLQLHEEGIINNLSKKWMHRNSGLLCDSSSAEGTHFKAVFILLVMLLSGIALSILLMFGEWLVHSIVSKTKSNETLRRDESSFMIENNYKINSNKTSVGSFNANNITDIDY